MNGSAKASAEWAGSRGATAGTERAGCGPIVEVPRCFLSTLKAGFFSSARARLETALLAGRRDGRWFERFAEMCQGLTSCGRSHPRLRSLANLRFEVSRLLPTVYCKPDIATTPKGTHKEAPPPPEPIADLASELL